MIYGLLGELRIARDDESFLSLPNGHALVILATLALNANAITRTDDLIRRAWGDKGTEIVQLHKQISKLRGVLAMIGREGDLQTRGRAGYELRINERDADWLWFRSLLKQADRARAEQRVEDEMGLLRSGLDLWHGPQPLVNVPSEEFRYDVGQLVQRRRRAAARFFERRLAQGDAENILDELAALFEAYPADEKLCGQLMVAAYRADRGPAVIAAFERHRDACADETGQDPDPSLRSLYHAVVRADPTAISRAAATVVPPATTAHPAPPVPRQLPPDYPLVGRDELAAEVSWLLTREAGAAAPVIVISGPGGMGKTALALRASYMSIANYPEGQLYAQLRDTTGAAVDTGEVLAQFLRALGAAALPEDKTERRALYRTLTAHRRVLIVLDDAADGAQVADLVPANSQCAVIVTARQRLPELVGAHHVAPLEPLPRPYAKELFLRVVDSAGITLVDDETAVGRVVQLCGGLPLALRIAAALRVHDHPLPTAALADRLARQGLPALSFRELSVARTIGAGFDRLDTEAQRLLLGLGLLRVPSFAPWVAEALLDGTSSDPMSALSQLSASFMIDVTGDVPRYRFHDLTREWAGQNARLTFSVDAETTAARAYTALLTLVRHAHTSLYGGAFDVVHSDVPDWVAPSATLATITAAPLDWFEEERANIRAAVEHCAVLGLTEICWDLAVSTHEFYTVRGYFDDWYATHAIALQACQRAGHRRGEGIVLVCLGQPALVSSRRHGVVSGIAELERGLGLLAEVGDHHGQAIALRTLANALRRQGHLTRPLALFQEAREHYQNSGDTPGSWQALRFVGQSYLDLGRHEDARRVLEEAGAEAEAMGNARLLAQARYWIGQACLAVGDLTSAENAFTAMLEVFGGHPSVGQAYARHGLGEVAAKRGDYPQAQRELDVAGELARSGADTVLEGRVHLSVAALHRAQARDDLEIGELTSAVSLFAGCGAVHLEVRALAARGAAEAKHGTVAAQDAAWARIAQLYAAGDVPVTDQIQRGNG